MIFDPNHKRDPKTLKRKTSSEPNAPKRQCEAPQPGTVILQDLKTKAAEP